MKMHKMTKCFVEDIETCISLLKDIRVFWCCGQFPVVGYKLEQDDPVDKEASYWYYAPK